MKAPRMRLGLRREVLILVPVSLLLVVALATFAAFAYRNALELLAGERRQDAARLARDVAARLPPGASAADPLRPLVRNALGAALVDARGSAVAAVGELPASGLLAPLAGTPPAAAVGVGLDRELPDRVAGFAPLPGGRTLRVDLPAALLAAQRRAARVLLLVVVGVGAGVLVLVLLFLRHLLAPYEAMLARAREVHGPAEAAADDEVAFVVATFERAMEALARPAPGGPEDDIAALERTLAPSLESGLLLLGRDGGVLALNPVGAELLGVAPPAAGTPLAEALASHPELAAMLAEAVAAGRGVKRREFDLGERALGLSLHPLRRDDGGVRGHLVLFADLTEARRRARERRLAESLEQLGELAAGVAHELRNSLATLAGYLELIERRPEEGSVADYLGEMRRETEQLGRVVEDFLAFARPGTARAEEVELAALARRAAADPALAGAGVTIEGEAATLRGDPQLLERAIRNLLHNAVAAEREAGRAGGVRLRLGDTAEGIEVAVEDRGRGLPPAVRERLFHPFVTGRAGGVGLGLSLTHRIVTLHGGRIELEDRPGGGTRARIVFPPPGKDVT